LALFSAVCVGFVLVFFANAQLPIYDIASTLKLKRSLSLGKSRWLIDRGDVGADAISNIRQLVLPKTQTSVFSARQVSINVRRQYDDFSPLFVFIYLIIPLHSFIETTKRDSPRSRYRRRSPVSSPLSLPLALALFLRVESEKTNQATQLVSKRMPPRGGNAQRGGRGRGGRGAQKRGSGKRGDKTEQKKGAKLGSQPQNEGKKEALAIKPPVEEITNNEADVRWLAAAAALDTSATSPRNFAAALGALFSAEKKRQKGGTSSSSSASLSSLSSPSPSFSDGSLSVPSSSVEGETAPPSVGSVQKVLEAATDAVRRLVDGSEWSTEGPSTPRASDSSDADVGDIVTLSQVCDRFCVLLETAALALGGRVGLPLSVSSEGAASCGDVFDLLFWEVFPHVRLLSRSSQQRPSLAESDSSTVATKWSREPRCVLCRRPKRTRCVCSTADTTVCVPHNFLRGLARVLFDHGSVLFSAAEASPSPGSPSSSGLGDPVWSSQRFCRLEVLYEFLQPLCRVSVRSMPVEPVLMRATQRLAVNCVGNSVFRSMPKAPVQSDLLRRHVFRGFFDVMSEQILFGLSLRREALLKDIIRGDMASSGLVADIPGSKRDVSPAEDAKLLCSTLRAAELLLPELTDLPTAEADAETSQSAHPVPKSDPPRVTYLDEIHVNFLIDAAKECLSMYQFLEGPGTTGRSLSASGGKLRLHALSLLSEMMRLFPSVLFPRWGELLPMHAVSDWAPRLARPARPFENLFVLLRCETAHRSKTEVLSALAVFLEQKHTLTYVRNASEPRSRSSAGRIGTPPSMSSGSALTLGHGVATLLRNLHEVLCADAHDLVGTFRPGLAQPRGAKVLFQTQLRLSTLLATHTPYGKCGTGLPERLLGVAAEVLDRVAEAPEYDEEVAATLQFLSAFFSRRQTVSEAARNTTASSSVMVVDALRASLAAADSSATSLIHRILDIGRLPPEARTAPLEAMACVASIFSHPAYAEALLGCGIASPVVTKLFDTVVAPLRTPQSPLLVGALRSAAALSKFAPERATALWDDVLLAKDASFPDSLTLVRHGHDPHHFVRVAVAELISAYLSSVERVSPVLAGELSTLMAFTGEASRDSIPAVRSAAVSALGAVGTLSIRRVELSTGDSPVDLVRLQKSFAKLIKRATLDDRVFVRLRAVAVLSAICFVLGSEADTDSSALLPLLPHIAIKASTDDDTRVRANGLRALAGLLECVWRGLPRLSQPTAALAAALGSSPHSRLSGDGTPIVAFAVPKWVLKAVALTTQSLPVEGDGRGASVKECWNACAAAVVIFSSPVAFLLDTETACGLLDPNSRPAIVALLLALSATLMQSSNFRTCIRASEALRAALRGVSQLLEAERSSAGSTEGVGDSAKYVALCSSSSLNEVWRSVTCATEAFLSGSVADFSQQRYREELESAFINTALDLGELTLKLHALGFVRASHAAADDAVAGQRPATVLEELRTAALFELLDKQQSRDEMIARFSVPAEAESSGDDEPAGDVSGGSDIFPASRARVASSVPSSRSGAIMQGLLPLLRPPIEGARVG
jgi:hypothetical protein